LLLFALLAPWAANAQTTVTIGEGTATSNTNPIGTYYNYSITEQLYTAEEIGMAGTISSISFYYMGIAAKDLPITVYMANVDAEDLTSGISLADAEQVFSGTLPVTTTAGWVTINLATPFAYDGTSSLLIGFIKDYLYYFSGQSWQGTATTTTMARYTQSDSAGPYTTSTVPGTAQANRPNIQMEITPSGGPTCDKPATLVVSDITGYGATCTWESNVGNYTFEYKKAADSEWRVVDGLTANTYTLSDLEPMTAYNTRVKAICDAGLESGYRTANFTTKEVCPDGMVCIGTGTATNSNVPVTTCYNYSLSQQIYTAAEIGEAGAILSIDFYSTNGAQKARNFNIYMVNTNKSSFESATDWIAVTAADLVYSATNYTWQTGWNSFELDNPFVYDGTSNVAIVVDDEKATDYECSVSFYVFDAPSQAIYVRQDGADYDPFNTTYTATGVLNTKNRIRLAIGEPPACPKPTGLTVSNVTAHTADLSWTENGDATEWEISYELEGREYTAQATTNPFTLTGLEPDAEYTVKVRANCGEGDYSDWTGTQTFTTDVACHAPTNLIVSDITVTSAVVSWTGDASSYNLRYRELTAADFATITFTADDVWQDGTGYQMLLDADATAYGTIIPVSGGLTSNGSASAAVYAEFEYKIPENADGATTTTNVLIAQSVSILVPAGTYDYCITNPTPGDRIWIAGGDYGRQDDYVFEAGKTYEFHVQSNGDGGDEVVVTVTEPGTKGEPKAGWTEINGVTSPYTITVEGEKDYVVEVQADCGAEGTSVWTSQNFQTPSNCQTPTPLDATEVTANSATLNWTGVLDSYQVQYRTAGSRELLFFEDFDGQPTTWTLTNAVYNRTSSVTTDYFVFLGSGYTEAAYMITPELTGFENGGTLEFMHRAYNGTPTFQVGFSTTTNDVDAFTWGSEVAAATGLFGAYSVALPNGTKYVAITTTTETSDCCVLINDFGIYGNEIPAGSWNTATANATSLPISGLIGNTQYEWQVRGVNSSCDGGYTEWSTMVTFTTEPSCLVPTNLSYNNGMLSWTSDATSFDIQFEGEEVIEGVSNPYTPELDPETIYSVRVRANCGSGDYSDWTDYIDFVTDCSGAKDLPYEFGFDLADLGEYYACWYADSYNTANDAGLALDPADNSNIVFRFSSYNSASDYTQILVSPELNTEAAVAVQFDYKGYGSGTETMVVGYVTDDEIFLTDTITATTTAWATFEKTFPAGTKNIVVYYISNYQWYAYLDNFRFEESTGVTQAIALSEGWNWVSLYVEGDPVDMIQQLEAALGDNGMQIESQYEGVTENIGDGYWWGDLDGVGIVNENMYLIEAAADCEVEMQGEVADPANHLITLYPEWTWIGFPCSEEVNTEVALSGLEAEDGDMIEAQDGVAEYLGDGFWWGIETLVPGEGYMYYSNSAEEKTFVFRTVSEGKALRVVGQAKPERRPVKLTVSEVKAFRVVDQTKPMRLPVELTVKKVK